MEPEVAKGEWEKRRGESFTAGPNARRNDVTSM